MAMGAMRKAALNIRQGNTVSIVVRGRESRPHGEVRQSTAQYNLRKGVRDTMRSPEVILKNLGDKAKDKSYQFKRAAGLSENRILRGKHDGGNRREHTGRHEYGKGQSNHRIAERPQLSAATSQAEVYCKEKQWQKTATGYSIHG